MSETTDQSEQPPIDLLRVQLSGEDMHVWVNADVFEDPGDWGHILSGLVRQIAEALQQEGRDPSATMAAIGGVFNADLDKGFPGAAE